MKSVKLPSLTDSDLLKTNEGPQSQEILNFAKTISSFPSDVSLSNLAILLNKYYGALSGSVDGYSLTSPYQNLGEKIKESMLPKAEQSEQYAYKTQ